MSEGQVSFYSSSYGGTSRSLGAVDDLTDVRLSGKRDEQRASASSLGKMIRRRFWQILLPTEVSLCNIATAARSIKAHETKVEEIVGKSKREVQMLIAPPVERKPRERVRPVVFSKKTEVAASEVKEEREERYEMKFSVT